MKTGYTYGEFKKWDGSYYMAEREKAEKAEEAMIKKMTAEEIDKYYDTAMDFVYHDSKKTFTALNNIIKPYGFTVRQAMIVY